METGVIYKYCYFSALLLFIGVLTSGLVSNLLIIALHPQPAWVDIETYAANFHPIQMLPFWAGFIILVGFIGVVAGVHSVASNNHTFFTRLALVSTTVYAALISLNYILQLGVLQAAITKNELEGMHLLAFGNPHSITMGIEMLGYAFQGTATWLIGFALEESTLGKWIRRLGILNGLVSIAGVLIQGLNISMSIDNAFGQIVFIGWNVLFLVLCLLYVLYFKLKRTANREKARKVTLNSTY